MRRLAFVAAVAGLACGGGRNRLNGTISSQASLAFDEVRAEWLIDQLSVRYLQGEGLALQEPVRLTVPAALADAGVEITIEQRVLVEHFVSQGDASGQFVPEKPFPPVGHGVLHLTRLDTRLGGRVDGDFKITFAGAEDTLNGDFSATVSKPK